MTSEHQLPAKKLNERQWESVVTRLYGTPGGEDDPMNKHAHKVKSNAPKRHPVEIERTIDRLYNPNPHKQEWLLQQRVAILDKELRACKTKPKISKTSQQMAHGNLHIVDRVDRIIADKAQKMAELTSLVDQEEGGNIRGTPYISPRAKALSPASIRIRIRTVYGSVSYISPRAKALNRSYKDLISWDAERS